MNDRDFCLWLQGFVELSGDKPTDAQWKSIKEHLALVFNKVTPPVGKKDNSQKELDSILDNIKRMNNLPIQDSPWILPNHNQYTITC
jgi:hypothetical protein